MIFPTTSRTKRLLSGALAVWMSGIVFLVCCGAAYAKPAAPETSSCPLAKKGHCSRSTKSEDSKPPAFALKDNPTADCCAFLSQFYNKNQKTESSVQIAELPAKTGLEDQVFAVVNTCSAIAVTYQPPFFDRSGTYLKNRVFRI